MDILSHSGKLWQGEEELPLKGVNWFGFETKDRVVNGLWAHNIDYYLNFLKVNKFNILRIPFSAELALNWETLLPDPETINYDKNPELVGLKAIEILDLLIDKAKERDILIMLDQHRLMGNGAITELWYDNARGYNEGLILWSWYQIITRYMDKENVVAVDLKNEPHGAATWGTGDLKTDWRLAAERIGNYILSLNSKLLIFVEGIGNNMIDLTQEGDWWGGNLSAIKEEPIRLLNPQKLVYSPHVYGPNVANQAYFNTQDFPDNMPDIWNRQWAHEGVDQAIIIGEWGGKGEGKDLTWHNALVDYLLIRGMRSNFYWCLNPNSHDTGGLLDDNWDKPIQWKLDLLARLQGEEIDPVTPPPSPNPGEFNGKDKFLQLYNALHNSANGYFNPQGIPYHSVETLIVEAPDHGHETTSEAYSYYIWLEALHGKLTGDWSGLEKAWENMETYMIPPQSQQGYNPTKPASYAPEWETPEQYPAELEFKTPVGWDPLASQLKGNFYGMHWLLDVDNWYGYGANGTQDPTFINTFQRGPQESVWETVPQPSVEDFSHGGTYGYLDISTKDPTGNYNKQWRYTNAPDADARVVQAIYWAKQWADQQGGSSIVDGLVTKAVKMGDWLRYSFFDKYFKAIGCQDKNARGAGYNSCHYLLSWYYAWGGPLVPQNWAFRIGCSHSHSGYQNPFTAWALSSVDSFKNKLSTKSQGDWKKSFKRQLQLYAWLQSVEGGIAGGVTNSLNGRYEVYPPGTKTFHKMAYEEAPVYLDPPSNKWFGFQAWSMERVVQYYSETKDNSVLPLIEKWINWAYDNCNWENMEIPGDLEWQGEPDTSFSAPEALPGENKGLHVTVKTHSKDVGIMACLARSFFYFSHGTGKDKYKVAGEDLLEEIIRHKDNLGYSTVEERGDYTRFMDKVYVPPNWNGTMPNGDTINSNSTFLSIRSKYQDDTLWPVVQNALDKGEAPKFRYHRFWAQVEIALAFGLHHVLFTDTEEPEEPEEPEDPEEPVGISLKEEVTNTWVSGGKTHKQYDLIITNHLSSDIKSLLIEATDMDMMQVWNLELKVPGEPKVFALPSWLESNGGIKVGQSHKAGYISTSAHKLKVAGYTT